MHAHVSSARSRAENLSPKVTKHTVGSHHLIALAWGHGGEALPDRRHLLRVAFGHCSAPIPVRSRTSPWRSPRAAYLAAMGTIPNRAWRRISGSTAPTVGRGCLGMAWAHSSKEASTGVRR